MYRDDLATDYGFRPWHNPAESIPDFRTSLFPYCPCSPPSCTPADRFVCMLSLACVARCEASEARLNPMRPSDTKSVRENTRISPLSLTDAGVSIRGDSGGRLSIAGQSLLRLRSGIVRVFDCKPNSGAAKGSRQPRRKKAAFLSPTGAKRNVLFCKPCKQGGRA